MKIIFRTHLVASLAAAVVAALLMTPLAAPAIGQNAPAKKYPPYPDVWGRELPVPDGMNIQAAPGWGGG